MKHLYYSLMEIEIPTYLEYTIYAVLIIITIMALKTAYKAFRESIVSFKNIVDQTKKNAVYKLAPNRYRYFAGLNTAYLEMPRNKKISKLYEKYKYPIAVAACDCLTKIPFHADYQIDADGTRHRSDVFFLLCTGINAGQLSTPKPHALFEDPFGKIISQPLADVSMDEAEQMLNHFCILEMKYYPDKESAQVMAIHVTNLTANGYVNKKGKPYCWLRQKFTYMWKITTAYKNTNPGTCLSKLADDDKDERTLELMERSSGIKLTREMTS